jgi:hypothetical protein
MFDNRKRRLAMEALMLGTLIVRGVQLGDEIHRLYKAHKPKHALGFAQAERKLWYDVSRLRPRSSNRRSRSSL